MGSKILVSAICPTFSRPVYLLHAVKLFLAQTWKNAELIVLDDSPATLQPDLSRFPNVRHVKLDGRISIGAKHTMGHHLAQGEAFVYWDDDDWYSPLRLVRQLDPIVRGIAKIVGFRRNLVLTTGPNGGWAKLNPRGMEPSLWIGNGATNGHAPDAVESPLTKREREVLQLVADGHSTTEIARNLFISAKTVKNHLASIYAKLDSRDRTQAVLSGMRLGIVQLQ